MDAPSTGPQLTRAQLLWRIARIVRSFAAIGIMGFWLGTLGVAICGAVIALFWMVRKFPLFSLFVMFLSSGSRR